jgi:hypothetical protein
MNAMSQPLQYEDVERFLRTFSTENPPFHFGALLNLVLAGLENLRNHSTPSDIRAHAHFITEEQVDFLRRLLEDRAESIEWFKDHIGHSSQTGLL